MWASALLLAASVAGKILALVRDTLVARYFGASHGTDAFFVALTVPAIVATAVGASLATGLIPASSEQPDERRVREFHSRVFEATLAISAALSCLIWALSGVITPLLARQLGPSFAVDAAPHMGSLGIWLISQIVNTVLTGIFHSRKRFLVPAVCQLIEVVGVITVLIAGSTHWSEQVLVVSWTIGSGLSCALLTVSYLAFLGYRPSWNLLATDILGLLRVAPMFVLAFALGSAHAGVDRYYAGQLPDGGITALTYGYALINVPVYLITFPMASAAMPYLSEMAQAGNKQGVRTTMLAMSRGALALLIPAATFTVLDAEGIVRLVYQRGAFSPDDTLLTATALRAFAVGLVPFSFHLLLSIALYAFKDVGGVVTGLSAGLFVKVLMSWMTVGEHGVVGLALSTSAALAVSCSLMSIRLAARLPAIWFSRDRALWRGIAASVVATVTAVSAHGVCAWLGFAPNPPWNWAILLATFALTYGLLFPGDLATMRRALASGWRR